MPEKTLLYYWMSLYKRKKAVVLIVVISVITAIVFSKNITPVYEARTVFYVPSDSQALSFMSDTTVNMIARDKMRPDINEDASAPYIGLLKSKEIAERVHRELPQKEVQKLLISDIDIEITKEFMLQLYSRDEDPELAADVAAAYVKNFNSLLQDASLQNIQQDISLIAGQISKTKEKLVKAEEAVNLFEKENNIVSINEEINSLTSQRISFQNQLEATNILIKENIEKIDSVSEQFKREEALYSERDFVLTNPIIEHLQEKLSDLSAQINALSVELKAAHPDLLMLKSQYKEISYRLEEEIKRFISAQIKSKDTFYEELRQRLVNFLIEKNNLQATKEGYAEVIKRTSERLLELPAIKTEWDRLNEEVLRYKKNYEQLKLNLEEAEMQESRQIQFVVVVDKATPPESPSFPILWINLIVAVLFSLVAGVFYAFFIDYVEESGNIRTRKIIKELISK